MLGRQPNLQSLVKDIYVWPPALLCSGCPPENTMLRMVNFHGVLSPHLQCRLPRVPHLSLAFHQIPSCIAHLGDLITLLLPVGCLESTPDSSAGVYRVTR